MTDLNDLALDITRILSAGPILSAGELAMRTRTTTAAVLEAIKLLGDRVHRSPSGAGYSMISKPIIETGEGAIARFRRLRDMGYRCVARRVSEHGSDASYDGNGNVIPDTRTTRVTCEHGGGTVPDCPDCGGRGYYFSKSGRTVRVYRIRGKAIGGFSPDLVYDFLFCFGDRGEGPSARLGGPYEPTAELTYGGGFWERVKL